MLAASTRSLTPTTRSATLTSSACCTKNSSPAIPAEDEQWLKDFKAQVRQFSGDANVYRYRGRVVFTDDRNGRFSVKELESFDPDMVAQYTRIVAKEQFDEDAFRNDHPELWERLRAQRFLVK
jgi:hypothetical protein